MRRFRRFSRIKSHAEGLGEPIRVFPGHFGGVETPMAYADGVVHAPVVNLRAWSTPV